MKIKMVELVVGLVFFHLLFWHEQIGLNAFLFSVLTLSLCFGNNLELLKSRKIVLYAIAFLLSSAGVSLFNSIPSKIAFFASFFVFIGFVWKSQYKTVFLAAFVGISNFFSSVVTAFRNSADQQWQLFGKYKVFRIVKITLIPLLVSFLFILIFRQANPVFENYTNSFMETIFTFLKTISWAWVFFMCLGVLIITAILYRGIYPKRFDNELQKGEYVIRKRRILNKYIPRRYSRFKNEFLSGIILIILVNIIALVINIIDVNFIWFGFEENPDMNYKQLVHEGTYFLILSILLSMIILLYYFRSSFNFYSKNKLLKILSNIWIVQNGIMGVSVLIRNLLYIGHFGLAYKRIGVMIFLILVLIGLITMVLKIRDKRSGFYLYRINTFAAFILLISMSLVNWDVLITSYNLKHNYPAEIDMDFLSDMSIKAYPEIFRHLDKLNEHELHEFYSYDYSTEYKIEKLNDKMKNTSFMSLNMADFKAYKYFEKIDISKIYNEKDTKKNDEYEVEEIYEFEGSLP